MLPTTTLDTIGLETVNSTLALRHS